MHYLDLIKYAIQIEIPIFFVGTVLQYGTLDYYWYFLATQDLNCKQEQTQADREPN
jgi:hypothetical protein